MTQKLIVIDACMRDGESRTKKILKPIPDFVNVSPKIRR